MDDRRSEEAFRVLKALYDNVPSEVHVWKLNRDPDGVITGWSLVDANARALQSWGKTLNDVVGRTSEELFPNSNSTELFMPTVERIFATQRPYEWEEFVADTRQILHMVSIPLDDQFISCGTDVSTYRDVEAELTTKSGELDASVRRLQVAAEAAQIGIWEYDLENRTVVWDHSMYSIYGVQPTNERMPYEIWLNGVHEEDARRASKELEEAIASGGHFKSRFRIVRQDSGEIRHISAQAVTEYDEHGKPTRMIGVNIDESDRHEAEEEIQRLAYYDTLTGLPNRALIRDRLEQAIARSGRTKRHGALIFIDLDHFKHLNDSFGHVVGDDLLTTLAPRLTQSVGRDDTVGRFGGDEFVAILNDLSSDDMAAAKSVEEVTSRIARTIAEPIDLTSGAYVAHASFGISVFMGSETDADEVLRQADLAMFRAKGSGRNTTRFFDESMEREVLERLALERDLEEAVEKGQFELRYQPQLSDDGRVRGAEALLRWLHPEHGSVPPNVFIPLAEESGQIRKLGRWVLATALSDLAGSLGQHADEAFTVSINVSTVELHNHGFQEEFRSDVLASGLDPSRIIVELTESALALSEHEIADKMQPLRAIGIRFSLDDFGTGYSSLTRLKQLPIDELKIDQSFVRDIATNADSQSIARSVIALAGSMGISVIAEGVESDRHQTLLREMGCHRYQGYYFARPMDVDCLVDFLDEQRKRVVA